MDRRKFLTAIALTTGSIALFGKRSLAAILQDPAFQYNSFFWLTHKYLKIIYIICTSEICISAHPFSP